MKKQTPWLKCPAPETSIWRYLDLPRFISLLESSELHLTRLDRFPDPWEGLWPSGILDAVRVQIDSKFPTSDIQDFARRLRQRIYASCWHVSDIESAAFWSSYPSAPIAIRSTVGKLEGCLQASPDYALGLVEYTDFMSQDQNLNLFIGARPAFLKRRSFQHECELRLVTIDVESLRADGPPPREFARVPIALRDFIERVYLGPSCPSWLLEPMRQLVSRYGISPASVVRSSLFDPA